MKQPELFLEREGHGRGWHFSLHASGTWHLKESGHVRAVWSRPDEVAPGYTRAVGIVLPPPVAHHDEPAPDDVILVPVVPDSDPVSFSLYLEEPGANLDSWAGKNADGIAFVGRIPLAGGAGTCCVIALPEPLCRGR